jgi:hypothetical protein
MSDARESATVFGALKPNTPFWDVLGNPWVKKPERHVTIPNSGGRQRRVNAVALKRPVHDGPASLGVVPGGWGDFFPQAKVYAANPNERHKESI